MIVWKSNLFKYINNLYYLLTASLSFPSRFLLQILGCIFRCLFKSKSGSFDPLIKRIKKLQKLNFISKGTNIHRLSCRNTVRETKSVIKLMYSL